MQSMVLAMGGTTAKSLLGLLVAALVAAGCSPKTYPVSLSFSLDDGSLITAGAVVVRHATDPAILGGGPIAADGTCRPMLRGRSVPGLPSGTYQIGVVGPTPFNIDEPAEPIAFDASFTNPADSGLTLTVGPGHPDRADFTLTPPRRR